MRGLHHRSIILATETSTKGIILGPWEVSVPGVALLLENCSSSDATVVIEGSASVSGPFYIGYGSDGVISLTPGGRVITTMAADLVEDDVVKFLRFSLQTAIETGFVKVDVIGFDPLPECQMETPAVGEITSWWKKK